MEVIWRPEAEQQFDHIIDYLAVEAGKKTARRIAEKILKVVEKLALQPGMGQVEPILEGMSYSYRSFVADKNYKIIYCIDKNAVHIFAVWDCRQNPKTLKKRVTGKK